VSAIIADDEKHGIAANSEAAMTSAMVNYQKILRQELKDDDRPGVYQGANARRRIREMQRRRRRRL
jgi:hypothetical protein